MRSPLDSYGPEPETDPPFDPRNSGPRNNDPLRWLRWVQLAATSALLVLFFNQLIQIQDVNRRIARLYERMDLLETARIADTTPALEAQQRTILQRLQQIENSLGDLKLEDRSSGSGSDPAALQAPPPPQP